MRERHSQRMIGGVVWTLVAALAGVLGTAPAVMAQEERTVKEGVYSTAQAVRGRTQYEATCMRCHGADLTGGAGRSLTGDVFVRDWTGLTLDRLFERMQSMPPGASEALAGDAYVDIISYVLERNGYPAGDEELSATVLTTVTVEGEDGPGVVPNFALVRVVGCLGGDASQWVLSNASDEVRSSDPAASSGDELAEVQATLLGDREFGLMYVFPSPEVYLGHRVETKGLLIRDESGGGAASLNVTSVQSLAAVCEP